MNASKSAGHNTRGSLLLRLGSSGDAMNAFIAALTFDPYNVQALYNKALVHKQRGEATKSVETLEQLLRIDKSHDLAKKALQNIKQLYTRQQ